LAIYFSVAGRRRRAYKSLQFVTAPTAPWTQTRRTMVTGMPLLDKLLAAAVFIWLVYWIVSLTVRPRAKRIDRKKG